MNALPGKPHAQEEGIAKTRRCCTSLGARQINTDNDGFGMCNPRPHQQGSASVSPYFQHVAGAKRSDFPGGFQNFLEDLIRPEEPAGVAKDSGDDLFEGMVIQGERPEFAKTHPC